MLYGLSVQGNAPKFLSKLNANHVPVMAILVSALFAAVCVIVNKVMPKEALNYLMSLVVSSLIINWIIISLTHFYFKRSKNKEGVLKTKFPSLWFPLGNIICLIFLVGILPIMWFTGMELSIELIPVWLFVLYFCYRFPKYKWILLIIFLAYFLWRIYCLI